MPNHEYFRELCALAAIGQLSADEDEELNQHLYECESCCEANMEYAHVVQHQLPKGDPIRWRIKSSLPKAAHDSEVRDRFLARARAEGIEFTPEVVQPRRAKRRIRFWAAWRWQAPFAAAAVVTILWMGAAIYRLKKREVSGGGSLELQSLLAKENESLKTETQGIQQSADLLSSELVKAKREKSIDEQSLQRSQQQLEELLAKLQSLSVQSQLLETKRAELSKDVQLRDAALADLNAKDDKLRRENADNLSDRVMLESQVRDLSNQLDQQAAKFEQERQLMMVSKDVKQLMGARDLHIMDVHDTDGSGKSAKAFGRVFYGDGQELIFYAFDLPSGKLTPAKYTFQAWGEKETVSHSVRNLGTFTIDDHEQRRWVLRVTDPKLLKDIDSVFVTAEATGDAGEPHGKKLLYAYIVGQPNHP
jgi:hypothetical protein